MPTRTTAPEVPHETEDGLKRLAHTLDDVQSALGRLGTDLGVGGRDLLKDVETLVTSARRDTAKLGRTVRTDFEQLTRAITRTPPPPPPARPRRPATRPRAKTTPPAKKTAA